MIQKSSYKRRISPRNRLILSFFTHTIGASSFEKMEVPFGIARIANTPTP
jgi:hypothetical protein